MDIEASPRYIAFDAVEIDLVGRRVTVAGVQEELEPKAFDVLVLLAQSPGRAFARDDILDAVWSHRHVTPSVLNRVIKLIRESLGESAHRLHTLHGVGYRFDGEVRFFSHRPAADPLAPAPVAAASPTAAASETSTPKSVAPSLPSAVSSTAVPAAIRSASRRGGRLLIAAFAVIAAGIFLWQARHREAAPASPTLVVLPLHAIGDDKSETAFADGLSEELTTRLARVDGLCMISSTSAARARHDGFDAAQLAERLHATHALEGSLREDGGELRIDLRLIETPSGRTVWAQDFDRKSGEVFAVQREITQAVAAALALRMNLARDVAKAPDPQTYREYLKLRHLFSGASDEGPDDHANEDLRALAERAPDFAEAHGLLALNLAAEGEGEYKGDEALREVQRTLALDPGNADAHAAMAEIEFRTHDWAVADRELHAALATQPGDVILNLITGMWLSRLGYGERALAYFRTAHAADPLGYWTNNNLGSELDVLGRHDEAKPYLDALPGLETDPETSVTTSTARWWNAIWRHDYASARGFATQMPEKDGLKKAYVAATAALTDPSRWPEAETAVAERESKIGEPPQIELLLPQFHRAAAMLAMLEPGNQEPFGKILWTVEFAALRRDPAFQDFIKRMKFVDYWNANGWPPQCKPDGAGAKCD
ncbi:MAG: winged helix-turn-helix domain-containing protein [Rudaea sp.]|uniref:winged helix-turn-helix domain-containing tetratricopeptide repeat protein n=1 Tax=Rudaea sp. TaxID=2136325 RepID=UPI0039E687F8